METAMEFFQGSALNLHHISHKPPLEETSTTFKKGPQLVETVRSQAPLPRDLRRRAQPWRERGIAVEKPDEQMHMPQAISGPRECVYIYRERERQIDR